MCRRTIYDDGSMGIYCTVTSLCDGVTRSQSVTKYITPIHSAETCQKLVSVEYVVTATLFW